jgi:hypothetical protein
MKRLLALATILLALPLAGLAQKGPEPDYVKKATRIETALATLKAFGVPNLDGKWYFAGPFDNSDQKGFETVYPPEKGVDLKATYTGKNGATFGWTEYKDFKLGSMLNIKKIIPRNNNDAVVYLYHEFEAPKADRLPISLGADDTMSVWFNGNRLIHEDHMRPAAPDQYVTQLKLKEGKNALLLKVCQYGGGWEVYVSPEIPDTLPLKVQQQYAKDFPKSGISAPPPVAAGESKFYAMSTFTPPKDCLLEVGGLAFRPDGKLLVCTRRGEIWLIENPTAKDPAEAKYTRFASGLHEALGLSVVDNKTVFVTQRPELTKIVDNNGDGIADEFETICDRWGVSGDYHEYAFGPARDKEGNFYITLNVGFGGGHQAKVPWRGWCVKITPNGEMEPYAYGLRSPNGIATSPDGDIFYADNQGEWSASNKIHHIKRGQFYGHQASLKWLKDSPFAKTGSDKVASGMMYDGQAPPGKAGPKGFPELTPPCVWFPFGRMGQSLSQPTWDTTNGKFGPFAGQMFVGDQNRANVMRVALEKVNGEFQGACFPFRSGFQCGVNRIEFGPDGALYVGQTARGWGSIGGKSEGLQRIAFTGEVPLEIHHMTLTKSGFDFTFTKPVDPAAFQEKNALTLKSFTYIYHSTYGCPEQDTRPEVVQIGKLSADGKTLSVAVPDVKPGRIYEFRFNECKTRDGQAILHPDAYYTVNQLVK